MPYPEELVEPMREELTRMGVQELRTPDEVDAFMRENRERTALVFVNSVCGCAAGMARPGLALALTHDRVPGAVATVFAGQDLEATNRARAYFENHPPTSPQIALFKEGKLVRLIQRQEIEGRDPGDVATNLIQAFDRYCVAAG
ncbi:MAG: BrxA/BrxB family bacilliredoxin [Candidatus Eisenbacteria bacterium]|nr:BrxA/BrxB family bacilliredoxin [Candidatus Eisenbacteria bacterium]